jgi:hypothetical protein
VPITIPPTPKGAYRASATSAVTARLMPEIAAGSQGRWRLKNVLVRRRKSPLNGRENANQKSA